MGENTVHVALLLDTADIVATLLSDCQKHDTISLKGSERTLRAEDSIPAGHKIAVSPVREGDDIIKYGQKIGIATADISPGEWVHLHNMKSAYDADLKKRIEQ